jgi:hypothetical protein
LSYLWLLYGAATCFLLRFFTNRINFSGGYAARDLSVWSQHKFVRRNIFTMKFYNLFSTCPDTIFSFAHPVPGKIQTIRSICQKRGIFYIEIIINVFLNYFQQLNLSLWVYLESFWHTWDVMQCTSTIRGRKGVCGQIWVVSPGKMGKQFH